MDGQLTAWFNGQDSTSRNCPPPQTGHRDHQLVVVYPSPSANLEPPLRYPDFSYIFHPRPFAFPVLASVVYPPKMVRTASPTVPAFCVELRS